MTLENNIDRPVSKENIDEEPQRDFDFFVARQLLKKLLDKGLITLGEFDKITEKNRQTFSSYLSEIMPKIP